MFPTRQKREKWLRYSYQNPVHLWDLQAMLLDPMFYSEGSRPYRAINLPGGGASGMAVRDPAHNGAESEEPLIFGNPSGVNGAAIEITVAK